MKKWQEYAITLIGVFCFFALFELLLSNGTLNSYNEVVIILIIVNIVAAASLNLVAGYLGELALGHAGFMAIGAYTAALCLKIWKLNGFADMSKFAQVSGIIGALIVGGLVASIFGILIGIPALRLRGDYLGIVTLGFGEIIRIAIYNLDFKIGKIQFTGGARGFRGFAGKLDFKLAFWIAVVVLMLLYLIIRSRHGRAILAIREDEIAAEAVGIPTTFYKTFAFAVSAFFAGIAGGMLALHQTMIDPKKFTFMYSVEIFVIVVLGGMGSLTGTVIAAIILGILNELLRAVDQWRLVIYSALLIVMMIFRPEGLLGSKEFSLVGLVKWVIRKVKHTPSELEVNQEESKSDHESAEVK